MSTNTTRRSLLKAAPATDRTQWENALRSLASAEQDYAAYVANVFKPAEAAERAFEKAHGLVSPLPGTSDWRPYYDARQALLEKHGTAHCVPDHMHERVDALCEAASEEQQAVIQTPAPDLPALRWKLDFLLELEHAEDGDGGSLAGWAGHYVRQTLADIARLLPEGR